MSNRESYSLAGIACAIAVLSLSLLSAGTGSATANCVGLEVRTAEWGNGESSLARVELTTGTSATVAQLGTEINAIGYAAQQNLVYGIATARGGDLVRISTQGAVSDLGHVRGAWLGDAVAGAVLGGDLYVRSDRMLYAIGVDPSSGAFGTVTKALPLRPGEGADDVDDFALDPANGLLYGLRGASMVSIDPESGVVRELRVVQGLPDWARYGSVVVSGQVMYAIADDVSGQSRLYRLALDGPGPAIQLANWPAAEVTDLAGCLTSPPPPTTPPPPPPTTTHHPTPPPPTTTTSAKPAATTSKAVPAQFIPPTTTIPPATTTVPPPSPPPPVPVPRSTPAVLPAATVLAQPSGQERDIERRWALTTVVIVFGGGAVAARRLSRRSR